MRAAWRQKIGGRVWRVVFAPRADVVAVYRGIDKDDELPDGLDGFCHLKSRTIYISEGMSEAATVAALLHEVTHARLWDLDEETVVELADAQAEALRLMHKRRK